MKTDAAMIQLETPQFSDNVARTMLERADAAKEHSYPASSGGYAVSVLTKAGNIYEGVSYKSDTYTLTMHCEMSALAHAATHGEHEIVAITGPNCHMCKQLIWESALHSGIDVQVIMEDEGKIKRVPISTLMLYPWPSGNGQH